MILELSTKPYYSYDFMEWLKEFMRRKLASTYDIDGLSLNDKILARYDLFFDEALDLPISSREAILFAVSTMVVDKTTTHWKLSINSKLTVADTDAKLLNIVKTITYGNLVLPAYDILLKLFDYIKTNIEELYLIYLRRFI